MTTKITMPMLGEGAHEGTIGKWLKNVGDQVEEYEPIVEVITEKVNAEVPAPMSGKLSAILVKEGETVEVGTVLGEMLEVGVPVAAQAPSADHNASPASLDHTEEVEASFPNGRAAGGWYEDENEDTFGGVSLPSLPPDKAKPVKPHRYSPAVRRLAEEHQLDLVRLGIRGTGMGGRITRDDVLMYIEQQRRLQQPVPTRALPAFEDRVQAPPAVPAMHDQIAANAVRDQAQTPDPASKAVQQAFQTVAPRPAPLPVPEPASAPTPVAAPNFSEAAVAAQSSAGEDELVPLTPMRKAIADHMARSVQTSPHAWTMVEVDMTRLVKHRAQVKEEFKRREGVDLTYLPFMVKAVVDGLRRFPQMNASWAPDNSGIIMKRDLNIGVAIDVPDGLVVPVLHRADEKSLVGLARALNDLVTRARNRKLTMADVQGGTFTVNNPGAFGSVMSQPILNQPQAGIVTMEAIVKRPVVLTDAEGNDLVVVRSMMNVCISFDHRVVDGATAGRFLQYIKQWLETRDYSAGF